MRSGPGKLALFLLCLSLALAVPQLLAKKKEDTAPALDERKRAVHALNRLAFGPRPGDVEKVQAMGVDRWIDLQLHPEKIQDDALQSRLAPFHTLRMSSHEIAEDFPDGAMVKQVLDGKKPMPSDPARRAVYQVQIARLQQREQEKQQKTEAAAAPQPASAPAPSGPPAADGTKTMEELAAAAAASPDATPAMSADTP